MKKGVCKKGHNIEEVGRLKSGHCRKCSIENARSWYKNNFERKLAYCKNRYPAIKERKLAINKLWNKNNKDKVACISKRWSIKNKDKVRFNNWKRYGVLNRVGKPFSYPDYLKLYEEQCGKCKICLTELQTTKRLFDVDHDHNNGIVRGLLCSPCNAGLGHFKDSITNLQNATKYIEDFNARR